MRSGKPVWALIGMMAVVGGGVLLAQEGEMSAEMAAMDEAMAKAAAPGAAHEYLAQFEGTWRAQMRMFVGGETLEGRGTARSEMVLGGRFLQTTFKGELMGQNFIGMGLDGYDNVEQKFVSTWADTNGTMIVMLEGEQAEDGEARSMSGSYTDPVSGKKKQTRSEIKIVSTNRYTYEVWEKAGRGGFEKTMQIIFSRQ